MAGLSAPLRFSTAFVINPASRSAFFGSSLCKKHSTIHSTFHAMLLAHVAHGHLGWGGNSPFGEEILRDVDVFADEVFHIQSSTDRESSIEKRRTMHIGHVDLAHLNVRHEVARGNTGEVNTRRHTANKGDGVRLPCDQAAQP